MGENVILKGGFRLERTTREQEGEGGQKSLIFANFIYERPLTELMELPAKNYVPSVPTFKAIESL